MGALNVHLLKLMTGPIGPINGQFMRFRETRSSYERSGRQKKHVKTQQNESEGTRPLIGRWGSGPRNNVLLEKVDRADLRKVMGSTCRPIMTPKNGQSEMEKKR